MAIARHHSRYDHHVLAAHTEMVEFVMLAKIDSACDRLENGYRSVSQSWLSPIPSGLAYPG